MPASLSLKSKLASISAEAGASLIPAPREGRPKKAPEVIPDLREMEMASSDRSKLASLLLKRQEWALRAKEAAENLEGIKPKKDGTGGKKGINDLIKDIIRAWSIPDKFVCGSLRISMSEVPRISTDRDKLIQEMTSAGLQPKVVNRILVACTSTTVSYQMRVSDVKESGED